jgi:hypothetical protein
MNMPSTAQDGLLSVKRTQPVGSSRVQSWVLQAQLALETRPFRDRFVSKCLQAIAIISTNSTPPKLYLTGGSHGPTQ